MGGPQTLLPQLCQFQAADTPERLELFMARLHAYPKYMADNRELLREAPRERPDRAADRRRADDRPARADARDPDRRGRRAVARHGRAATRIARRSATSSATRSIPPTPRSSRRSGATTSPQSREENGIWSAPNGDALYRTQILRWTTLDLDPQEVHQIGPRRARVDRGRAADDRPRRRASATTPRPTGPRSPTTRPTRPPSQEALIARADGGHRARLRARARGCSAASPVSPVPGHPGRGVQGARRAVRLLLPAVGGHDPARARTTSTRSTCRRAPTRASPRRRTTRRSRATTSRSRSRARTRR